MSASADPFADPEFASTLLAEAATETPSTPAEEPAPATETAAEEAPTAGLTTPSPGARERDATGRFVAKAEASPADAAPETPAPAAAPAAETPAPEPSPADYAQQLAQLREENAQAKRREETLRGQVANAQRQAEATAYQRGAQEAEQRQRQATWAELDRLAATGEYDPALVQQARQGYQEQWAREDQARQQGQFLQQQASMELGAVALQMDHATVNLREKGIPSLASQAQLPEEYARAFFDDAETQRYQRAIGQAQMARQLGERGQGLGFNPVADRDYLETVYSGLWLAGQIHKELTTKAAAREAELQAEIDRLTIELNREEAPAVGLERAARGTGRKITDPDEYASATLRANADRLAALLRVG